MRKLIPIFSLVLVAVGCEMDIAEFDRELGRINQKVDQVQTDLVSAQDNAKLVAEAAEPLLGEYAPVLYTALTLAGVFGAKKAGDKVVKVQAEKQILEKMGRPVDKA